MKRLTAILKSDNFLVLSDQAVYSGASFFVTLILARIMSAQDFGIFSSIVLANFLIISITNALVIQPFQVNVHLECNKRSYQVFALVFQIIITLALLLAFVGLSLTSALPEVKKYMVGIIFFTLGFAMHDFFRKTFLAQHRIKQALIVDVLLALSQLAVLILAFTFSTSDLDTLLPKLGLSFIPALLASFYFSENTSEDMVEWGSYSKIHVKQGGWLLLVALLQWGSNNIFIITSGVFLGVEALGALRLVQSLFGVLNILLQTFENYVLPHATLLYQSSVQESKLYLKQISFKGAFVFGFVLLLLSVFSEQVISLAGGQKYAAYHHLVKGMALLYFILFAGYPIRMSIRMLILNKSFFIGYVFSFVFTVLSYTYLLRHWQLTGVIIGMIINQLLMLIYWQFQLSKNKFYLWK